jgi:gamma-glutamyltranspeptidase / glutathione hydrolase
MMILGRLPRSKRQLYSTLFLSLAVLGGCAETPRTPVGATGYVKGFLGGVAADEPNAALVMRDILSAGGTAVDAAVAGGFMLGVTLPSVAGLSGGGACLSFDSLSKRIDTVNFLPRTVAQGGMGVPMTPRGLALLHSKGGRLRIEQTIGPAEQAARLGTPLSRASAAYLNIPGVAPSLDRQTQALYFAPGGFPFAEGTPLRQPELASLLARLRLAGIGDLYTGLAARQLVDASKSVGGLLTLEDLRAALPLLEAPLQQALGSHVIATPGGAVGGGVIAADIFAQLQRLGFDKLPPPDRPQRFAEATRRAIAAYVKRSRGDAIAAPGTEASATALLADFRPGQPTPDAGLSLPEGSAPPGASLVAVDQTGSAVACTFTSGGLFGTGRSLPGTGLMLPPPASLNASLTPVLVVNLNAGKTFMAAAATGGGPATAAVMQVMSATFVDQHDLEEAVIRPRQFAEGPYLFLEPDADDSQERLKQQGYTPINAPGMGRVNVVFCPSGIPDQNPRCDQRTDPRGFGLALGQQQ